MWRIVALCALLMGCEKPTAIIQLVGPSRVQLVKSDGLFTDTLYPSAAFALDTSNDTGYTGDSTALLINPGLTDLRLSYLSFEDNYDYQTFHIARARVLKKGDTTLIIGDYVHYQSDAMALLPQTRKYSLNATIHFDRSLKAGYFKFVANVTVDCNCLTFPSYNCVGDFSIVSR
jgi:hypothetical protein